MYTSFQKNNENIALNFNTLNFNKKKLNNQLQIYLLNYFCYFNIS